MDFITKYFILVKADLHRSLVVVVVQVFVQLMKIFFHVYTFVYREEAFHCRKEGVSCQSFAVFRDKQFCFWKAVERFFGKIHHLFVISVAFCDLKQHHFQSPDSFIKSCLIILSFLYYVFLCLADIMPILSIIIGINS